MSNKTLLQKIASELEDLSRKERVADKYQSAFKTLSIKSKALKQQIPANKVEDTLMSFNIPVLNKTMKSIASFVNANNDCTESINSKAISIIETLKTHAKRNCNARHDAFDRTRNNMKQYEQSNILLSSSVESPKSTGSETEIITDFTAIKNRLAIQQKEQQQNKTQKSSDLNLSEWENHIFDSKPITGSSINTNTNTSTNISEKKEVESLDDITIKKIKPKKTKITSKKAKVKGYRSYANPTKAFEAAPWDVLVKGGKRAAQIAFLAAGQACGFSDGFTHKQIITHTNKMLSVSYDVTSSLDIQNNSWLKNDKKNEKKRKLIRVTNDQIIEHIKQIMPQKVRAYFNNLRTQSDITNTNQIKAKVQHKDTIIDESHNNQIYDNDIDDADYPMHNERNHTIDDIKDVTESFNNLKTKLNDIETYTYYIKLLTELHCDLNQDNAMNASEIIQKLSNDLENYISEANNMDTRIISDVNNMNITTNIVNESLQSASIALKKVNDELQQKYTTLQSKYDSVCDDNDDLYYRNQSLKKRNEDLLYDYDQMERKYRKKKKELKAIKNLNSEKLRSRSRSRGRYRKK